MDSGAAVVVLWRAGLGSSGRGSSAGAMAEETDCTAGLGCALWTWIWICWIWIWVLRTLARDVRYRSIMVHGEGSNDSTEWRFLIA
jgi:hypothetical protein